MNWSITVSHNKLPSYHIPTNRYAFPGIVKDGYLPYVFKSGTHYQVLQNYQLFSAIYYPFVARVFEHNNLLVFALNDIPEDRVMLLVDRGMFSFHGLEFDTVTPFAHALTDAFACPCIVEHTTIDGNDVTIIRRYINPRLFSDTDPSVYDVIGTDYRNVIIVDFDHVVEEQFDGHVSDTVLVMQTGSVSNNYKILDMEKFVRDLSLDISFSELTQFNEYAKMVVETSVNSKVKGTRKKEKKRRRFDRKI
jgi:hypothetical protein